MQKSSVCLVGVLCLLILMPEHALSRHRISLAPSLTVSEEYSSNLFLAEEDDDEEDGWITVVSPRMTLSAVGKTSSASLSYSPGFTYYANDKADSTIRHRASLNLSKQLSKRMDIYLTDTFVRTDEPFSENIDFNVNATTDEIDTEFIDREGREDFYTNDLSLGFSRQMAKHDTLNMNYSYRIRRKREPSDTHSYDTTYTHVFGAKDSWSLSYNFRDYKRKDQEDEDIDLESEDSVKHNPAFDLSYWFTDHVGVDTGLSYTRGLFSDDDDSFHNLEGNVRVIRNFTKHLDGYFSYRHTAFDSEGGDDDYQVFDPGIGISYAWSKNTFIDLRAGYFYQDNEEDDDEAGVSLSGDASKVWRLKKGSFTASGGTGYDQDYFGAENLGFTIYQYFDVSGLYNFTKRFSGSVSAGYRRDNYVNQDPERVDESYDLGAGLTYSPRPWLRIRLTERYRLMDSDDDDQNYDENRVTLSVSLIPRPWRLN